MSGTSEAAGAPAPAPAEFAPLPPEVPPLDPEQLPPNFRKHVDPASPVPMRGMAARGLVPLNPGDMCHCLAMLAGDPDPSIAASARKTASTLPDKILTVGLREEDQNPRTLHFFAQAQQGKDASLELIVLNNAAHDLTVAEVVARTSSARIIDIVANNQLRLLRDERVLRALLGNPATSASVVDSTCDFAVRSGLFLADLPQMVAAYIRVHGAPPAAPEPAPAPEEAGAAPAPAEDTAASIMRDMEGTGGGEEAPADEGRKLNLTQRIAKMNVSEKVKLATLGNKEARTILLREPNKLVQAAVIQSPRITDGEVLGLASAKTTSDDILRVIMHKREWLRQYTMRLALVKNPKVPAGTAFRLMATLRDAEIKELAGNKNVPSTVRIQAKKMLEKKK